MSDASAREPQSDPFRPPATPTLVGCLHCGQEYESYLIEWRLERTSDGGEEGFWCCPVPGCDGRGFGFDILPVDPEYRDENGGWVSFEDDDEEEDGEEDLDDEEEVDDEGEFGHGGPFGDDGGLFDDEIPFDDETERE